MKYDAIVIGFGKGGKTLAGTLAAKGQKVAMIEQDPMMYGGTCINVGCIPSKSLVRSSHLSDLAGGGFDDKSRRYGAAIAEKIRLTDMLRGKNYHKLADSPNVDVFDGVGSFLSNHEVQVDTGVGKEVLEGDKIFINTGADSFIPPIPGVKDNPFAYDSKGMLALEKLPEHLVIIGGGYIGLEFASMYTGFGSKVTIVAMETEFIGREDRDVADAIQAVFEKRGVTFHFGAKISSVNNDGKKAQVAFSAGGQDRVLDADAVLVATGRRPNVAGLNPEKAGVELTERGAIKVDEHLKTTADNIWAMGDVAGGLQHTYVSLDDFRIVLPQVLTGQALRSKAERKNVPYSVFIAPSYSRVGLNEKEAEAAGYDFLVAKMPTAAVPKAQVLRSPEGFLKALVDRKTKKILGAMLFCEESYEVINIIKLAMDLDADYTVLKNQIFTHPTMSEALNDLFGMVNL